MFIVVTTTGARFLVFVSFIFPGSSSVNDYSDRGVRITVS